MTAARNNKQAVERTGESNETEISQTFFVGRFVLRISDRRRLG